MFLKAHCSHCLEGVTVKTERSSVCLAGGYQRRGVGVGDGGKGEGK